MRLWHEQQKTYTALRSAQQARDNEREALLFTFAASDQITESALRLIAAPKPAESSVEDQRNREFCRQALGYYGEIARRYDRDQRMQAIAAAAYRRVGFIRMILEDPHAEEAIRQSIALYEKIVPSGATSQDLRLQLTLTYDDLVYVLRTTGRLRSNLNCLERLVTLRQALADDFPARNLYRISLTYNLTELAELLETAGRSVEAEDACQRLVDNYRLILKREPDNARACNNLAWLLASRAGASRADSMRTVELAERALAHAATEGGYWNTLGLARYRAGKWKAAAEALENSIRLRSGGDAYDWLLLAMARYRLGDRAEAKRYYERAVG